LTVLLFGLAAAARVFVIIISLSALYFNISRFYSKNKIKADDFLKNFYEPIDKAKKVWYAVKNN